MTSADVARMLERELAAVQREIALFRDDTLVWRTAPATPNSAGNLALHLAGNIQHFIGASLGRTGYVRDRDAEFNRRSGTRADLLAELDRAIAVVRQVLPAVSPDALAEEVDIRGVPPMPWGRFLIGPPPASYAPGSDASVPSARDPERVAKPLFSLTTEVGQCHKACHLNRKGP